MLSPPYLPHNIKGRWLFRAHLRMQQQCQFDIVRRWRSERLKRRALLRPKQIGRSPGIQGSACSQDIVPSFARTTTMGLKANRGSEQYQAMNCSTAYWYARREPGEVRLFSTANFEWSRSRNRSTMRR